MPFPRDSITKPKSVRDHSLLSTPQAKFDPNIAGRAIVDGLKYLQSRLDWSGTKIAVILHLPSNTVNTWINKYGQVPLSRNVLPPDIQAIIHLLAIHRSLEAMFNDPSHQKAWLSTMHPELKVIPEDLMGESVNGLIFIRQYLDYVRGRGA